MKHLSIKLWSIISISLVMIIISCIFGFLFIHGYEGISYEFFIKEPNGMPLGSEGGVYNAIIGSICFTGIATIFSFVFALSIATYLVFYEKNEKIKSFIRFIIGIIAGVPSIVLGLFGYSFLVVYLKIGISILTGGIVLGIMIFPFMEIRFEKTLLEVDINLIYASLSMGVNRTYTFFKIILPICYKDMIRATCLSASFAMGATAPILLTGAVYYADIPNSIFSPAMALPLHLYLLISEGISLKNAYATALVLIVLLLLINSIPTVLDMIGGNKIVRFIKRRKS
ncbi:ABC transporter permease subunit [Lutibacter sp. B2]|nr:ABC transporter permease subunit [Lutibacter sp. B2]